jgi:LuxR family maltose regulon positive regulatory protein
MPETLLATKTLIPPSAVYSLSRRRLFARLNETDSPACRLALVCAPAGYGKTTLVADWVRERSSTVADPGAGYCWLSLEEEDNSLYRFEAYLLASLQEMLPQIARGAAALLNDLSRRPPNA